MILQRRISCPFHPESSLENHGIHVGDSYLSTSPKSKRKTVKTKKIVNDFWTCKYCIRAHIYVDHYIGYEDYKVNYNLLQNSILLSDEGIVNNRSGYSVGFHYLSTNLEIKMYYLSNFNPFELPWGPKTPNPVIHTFNVNYPGKQIPKLINMRKIIRYMNNPCLGSLNQSSFEKFCW